MVGKYISHEFVRKDILKQSNEDILEMDGEIGLENASQDPRWLNPAIESNIQMMNQMAAEQQAVPQQQVEPQDKKDPEYQKMQEIRNALVFIKQMKQRGIEDRTPQEQSKYKQAVQILAKNPDLMRRMGLPAGTGQGEKGE
jgi:hypothetical protein